MIIDSATLAAAFAKLPDLTMTDDDNGPPPEFPALRFRFAKTMPEIRHFYVVRSAENNAEYEALFHLIAEQGVWEEFQGRRYQYLYLGPWKYWRMNNDLANSVVINRAKA
jgi:hypothetical protein